MNVEGLGSLGNTGFFAKTFNIQDGANYFK